jgi:CHAD domain-containing protein
MGAHVQAGARSPGKRLRETVARRLREATAELDGLLRGVARRARSGPVHDLRVLTRRVRAAVWMGRLLGGQRAFRRTRRLLRTLGRALGERRMIDVILEDAGRLGLDARRIEARKAGADGVLLRAVRRVRRRGLSDRLRRAAKALEAGASEDLPLALAGLAGRLTSAYARRRGGPATLHRLRVEAKKGRYVLELLRLPTARLREVQRRLGRWHDLEVLQRELGRNPRAAREQAAERQAAERVLARAVETSARDLLEAARRLWASVEKEAR